MRNQIEKQSNMPRLLLLGAGVSAVIAWLIYVNVGQSRAPKIEPKAERKAVPQAEFPYQFFSMNYKSVMDFSVLAGTPQFMRLFYNRISHAEDAAGALDEIKKRTLDNFLEVVLRNCIAVLLSKKKSIDEIKEHCQKIKNNFYSEQHKQDGRCNIIIDKEIADFVEARVKEATAVTGVSLKS